PISFVWIVPGLIAGFGDNEEQYPWLTILDDPVIAIAAGVLLFLLPGDRQGNMTLVWKDAEEGLPWGVLLLFGGAKLPKLARSLGQAKNEFEAGSRDSQLDAAREDPKKPES
ncbi:MAG: twin-arginine translocase TatA/TatE family subunit, partial [Actinobacteria bacterium]|nr:twin-arginine translocase TatA/TatE family subunit [Actinomycetota bacterium]